MIDNAFCLYILIKLMEQSNIFALTIFHFWFRIYLATIKSCFYKKCLLLRQTTLSFRNMFMVILFHRPQTHCINNMFYQVSRPLPVPINTNPHVISRDIIVAYKLKEVYASLHTH